MLVELKQFTTAKHVNALMYAYGRKYFKGRMSSYSRDHGRSWVMS